jgi:hypothetical protein
VRWLFLITSSRAEVPLSVLHQLSKLTVKHVDALPEALFIVKSLVLLATFSSASRYDLQTAIASVGMEMEPVVTNNIKMGASLEDRSGMFISKFPIPDLLLAIDSSGFVLLAVCSLKDTNGKSY